MARKVRVQYPGAVYHVMSRGNQGNAIFRDDRDRERFVETLGEACGKTGWLVHAYVLLGNHYHLLLETPEANLVAGMKWLQGTYTRRFNGRHRVFGHVLAGRYKAIIVDGTEEAYFGVVSTYIHLNPVRAGLVRVGEQRLREYRWSRGVVPVDQRAVGDGARVEREPGGGGGPGGRRASGASVEGGAEPRAGAGGSGPDQGGRLNDPGFRDPLSGPFQESLPEGPHRLRFPTFQVIPEPLAAERLSAHLRHRSHQRCPAQPLPKPSLADRLHRPIDRSQRQVGA